MDGAGSRLIEDDCVLIGVSTSYIAQFSTTTQKIDADAPKNGDDVVDWGAGEQLCTEGCELYPPHSPVPPFRIQ